MTRNYKVRAIILSCAYHLITYKIIIMHVKGGEAARSTYYDFTARLRNSFIKSYIVHYVYSIKTYRTRFARNDVFFFSN